MLVKLVVLAAILFIIHIAMEKYIVKDSKGGWAIISAVVWLGTSAAAMCAVAYAVIGG